MTSPFCLSAWMWRGTFRLEWKQPAAVAAGSTATGKQTGTIRLSSSLCFFRNLPSVPQLKHYFRSFAQCRSSQVLRCATSVLTTIAGETNSTGIVLLLLFQKGCPLIQRNKTGLINSKNERRKRKASSCSSSSK